MEKVARGRPAKRRKGRIIFFTENVDLSIDLEKFFLEIEEKDHKIKAFTLETDQTIAIVEKNIIEFNPSKIFLLYPPSSKKLERVLKQVKELNFKIEPQIVSNKNRDEMLDKIRAAI